MATAAKNPHRSFGVFVLAMSGFILGCQVGAPPFSGLISCALVIKEYSLNHNMKPYIIEAIFLNSLIEPL